ncbi:methyltransferase domain-containing protein [Pseudomonas tolaasii]
MTQNLPNGLTDTLLWSEEKGRGWHTRPAMLYSGDYFAHYQKLDALPMGALLTKARLELVRKYTDPSRSVDIGIGGGRYVKESGGSGYDVCADAVAWLKDCGRYLDPYAVPVDAIACWDSLEHIPEPEKLLAQVKSWLFVSMPIYDDLADLLQSKHYKPGEHLHYWTFAGFVKWAEDQGFQLMEMNHAETELGREGITSFAFKRIG